MPEGEPNRDVLLPSPEPLREHRRDHLRHRDELLGRVPLHHALEGREVVATPECEHHRCVAREVPDDVLPPREPLAGTNENTAKLAAVLAGAR